MRFLLTSILTLSLSLISIAQTVSLKITYKGNGADHHTVQVKHGDVVIGEGVTDSDGRVKIDCKGLISNRVDLAGKKTCNNARKSWTLNGYVELDGSNHADVKMEEAMKDMADMMGMSVDAMAKMYGLVCAGSSSGGETSSNPVDDKVEDKTGVDVGVFRDIKDMKDQREASQQQQKTGLGNEIAALDAKIARKEEKLADQEVKGKITQKEAEIGKIEIEELKVKREIKKNDMAKLDEEIAGTLNLEKRKKYKAREAELKEKKDGLKDKRKALEKASDVAAKPPVKKEPKEKEPEKEVSGTKSDKAEDEGNNVVSDEPGDEDESSSSYAQTEEEAAVVLDAKQMKKYDLMTDEELAEETASLPELGTGKLKQLKGQINQKLRSTKVNLKTTIKMMSLEKRAAKKRQVVQLEERKSRVEAELAKR